MANGGPRIGTLLTLLPAHQSNAVPDLSRFLTNLAPATRRAYLGHLRRYAESGRPLDRTNVVAYVAGLAVSGRSRKTVQQALAGIKTAVREAHYGGAVDGGTADAIRTIDVGWAGREKGVKVGRWLEVGQVRDLFRTIDRRIYAKANMEASNV